MVRSKHRILNKKKRKKIDFQLSETTDALQNRLDSTEARLRRTEETHTTDLEDALIKLEEEKQRYKVKVIDILGLFQKKLRSDSDGNLLR